MRAQDTIDDELEPLPLLRHPQLGEPAAVYRYTDPDGDLLYVVCRFAPKDFRQAHLDKGRWVWNLDGVPRTLYRLPQLQVALAAGQRIHIPEGEKDVHAIERAGGCATCNPMGAGPGKFTDEMAAQLEGARYITIWVDRDDEDKRDTPQARIAKSQSPAGADYLTPGERHALAIADRIVKNTGVASSDITFVQALAGKDAFDHLEGGHTLDEALTWQPPRPPPPEKPDTKPGQMSGHGFNLTDLGNAERLVDEHGPDLRYVPQLGWHIWDGRRWRPDVDGEVHRRAKVTVRQIAAAALTGLDGDDRTKQLKHAIRSEGRPRLEAMVAVAETDAAVVVRVDDLDSDRYQLNTLTGTVDLTTGTLRPHDRADHATKLAPVDYQPDAAAPTWARFLETIFHADRDLIGFVQRAVGYSLTGSTEEQVLFLMHGRGQNGKSTFIETVRSMLGDYAQQAPAEMLMQSSRGRGSATPDLARLPGSRFVAAVETGEGRRLDEPLVKQLTGGDRIAARRLYKDVFEFTPTHKLWLATNHLPQIAGTDDAIWRRIRLIPFTVRVPDQDKDPQLRAKLLEELPGILAWAIDGCSSYLVEGLEPPASVTGATQAYRDDMDELGAFIDECCVVEDDQTSAAKELLTLYGYWAQANSATPITATALARALVERGFAKGRNKHGVYYRGIGVSRADQAGLN